MVGRGRPRTSKATVTNLSDVTITPVANGYTLTSKDTGKELFVFEELDSVFEFVRAKLKPTSRERDFLDKI